MSCIPITTGSEFLIRTLSHLDCQAQSLGSLGYQALAAPGSPAAAMLAALLTLFVALLGIRLMLGEAVGRGDIVGSVLKIGIVLTLAVSWPAWRTLAYDTVIHGPAELAGLIVPASGNGAPGDLATRLQAADAGIAALTFAGTGRQTGAPLESGAAASFRSIALPDDTGLGFARPLYLASVIGPLAAVRIAAGLLLALAPIMAGLLLFDFSRGIFSGWVRGLVLAALGSLGITVLLVVQLAVMEPWLGDVAMRRSAGYTTPAAPTELLALVLGFAAAQFGLLAILGRVAFQTMAPALRALRQMSVPAAYAGSGTGINAVTTGLTETPLRTRAQAVSESVASVMRREDQAGQQGWSDRRIDPGATSSPAGARSSERPATTPLGSSYRRPAGSTMRSQRQRDSRT